MSPTKIILFVSCGIWPFQAFIVLVEAYIFATKLWTHTKHRFSWVAAALRLSLLALGVANTLCTLGLAFKPIKRAELLNDFFLVALICLGEYNMVIEAASLCEECDERRANSCLFAHYNGAFVVVVVIQIVIPVIKHVVPQFEIIKWLAPLLSTLFELYFAAISIQQALLATQTRHGSTQEALLGTQIRRGLHRILTAVSPASRQLRRKADVREALPSPADATELDGGITYGDEDVFTLGFTEQMVKEIVAGVDASIDRTRSAKSSLLLDILRHSRECGDKVLVFSSSIPTLNYFSDLFVSSDIRHGRIGGTTKVPDRIQLIEQFHKNSFDVLLVSTRAGGVDLNIQGANRVVIMDFGFNPAWEEQAVGRVYRLGQKKPVFVYRFLAGGTYETNMWNKQLFKTSLTQRVVDKKNPCRNARRNTRDFLHFPETVKQEDIARWVGKDPDVLDKILARHGQTEPGKIDTLIRAISTTETLQEEVEEELDDEEKKEVAAEIAQAVARPRG
ncbi:hypothetical protein KC340_g17109 [Hortaea werneckii]|nr:hypothetical protein KC339_g2134 [Hortaea werneckii]KAI7291398.1 hypothetical protein KC340_g17109 [Hortaea werneckii]